MEDVFVVSKIKNTVPWTYVINDVNGEEITGSFYEKELQKSIQEKIRIENVFKRKGDDDDDDDNDDGDGELFL